MKLVANTEYWNKRRGPHLSEVLFRNDLDPEKALELVCNTEGEVDLVTEVPPEYASRVKNSTFANLISVDAVRVLAGVINRDSDRFPFGDRQARLALNFAVDRDELVQEGLFDFGAPLAGLTPPSAAANLPHRLTPYRQNLKKAAELWSAAKATKAPLRLAAEIRHEPIARLLMKHFASVLDLPCDLTIYQPADLPKVRRRLAEKRLPQPWDVLLIEQGAQMADSPPLEIQRAFAGESGEFRAGPIVPKFEQLYNKLASQVALPKQARMAYQLDRFVFDEALALFLCAPAVLYAVNKQVSLTPYRTTFELAECSVSDKHWSMLSGS